MYIKTNKNSLGQFKKSRERFIHVSTPAGWKPRSGAGETYRKTSA